MALQALWGCSCLEEHELTSRGYDSIGLAWGPGTSISDKLSGIADTAHPQTTFWGQLAYNTLQMASPTITGTMHQWILQQNSWGSGFWTWWTQIQTLPWTVWALIPWAGHMAPHLGTGCSEVRWYPVLKNAMLHLAQKCSIALLSTLLL